MVESQPNKLPEGFKIPEIKGDDGQNLDLHPLQLNAKCVMGPNELIRNMRYAMGRQLPQFFKAEPHHGEAVLCGSGPSIADNIESIRTLYEQGHLIMAIKSTHDWLIERGITPHLALAVDPQPKIANLYRNPVPECTYLIASQCHPTVFQALENNKVVLWHCFTKKAQKYWEGYFKRKKKQRDRQIYFINGGSTSGLRAITLSWLMGYRKLNLFGYDSCLPGQGNKLLKVTGEQNEKGTCVVVVEDRHFFCDPAMACQGNEFLQQVKATARLQVKVWGDGFIPYASRLAAEMDDPQHVFTDEDWYALDHPERGTREAKPFTQDQEPPPNVLYDDDREPDVELKKAVGE